MKVLVLCEYSGIVRDAFTRLGHDATSVDLLPSESPGQHIVGDALTVARDLRPQLIIAHPPCTYLSKAGLHFCYSDPSRVVRRSAAVEFVKAIYDLPCPLIAIENPEGYLSTGWKPYNQIVYPFQFGDPYKKSICLWLKGLPPLISTCYSTKRYSVTRHVNGRMSQVEKSKIKSKFFPMTAAAMALQWS